MDKKTEAIGWVRVSTPKQWNDGNHIKQQEQMGEWCAENNIRCIKKAAAQYRKYENPRDNPVMRALLEEIDMLAEMGMQPDMVVATSIDRFGDENIILNVLLPFFESRNIAMVTIKEQVNSMTDREGFIKAVREDNAAARDAKRTEATQTDRVYKLQLRREQYGIGIARPIFGFKYSYNKGEYDEEKHSIVVKEFFVEYVYDHSTLSQISSGFTETRLKAPRSKAWDEKKVANILRNPAYATGITRAGIRCPTPIPMCTWNRAKLRLDIEKGGRKASVEEPLRKIVYCGYCGGAMRLRTCKGVRKYICRSCNKEQEEGWIMERAIGQTKMVLKEMLNEIVRKHGVSKVLQRSNELKNRIDTVFCDFKKVEAGDGKELVRMLKNYVPFELGKKLVVYSDSIEVQGMTVEEVMEELDLGEADWLEYVGKLQNYMCP